MFLIVSQLVVAILGIAICVLATWGLYAPKKLTQLVLKVVDQHFGLYFAVTVRLILGLSLIVASTASPFPRVFQVLGWIAIFAAAGLLWLGRRRMRKFVAVFERFSPLIIRLWLLFGIAFGAFLIYGVGYIQKF